MQMIASEKKLAKANSLGWDTGMEILALPASLSSRLTRSTYPIASRINNVMEATWKARPATMIFVPVLALRLFSAATLAKPPPAPWRARLTKSHGMNIRAYALGGMREASTLTYLTMSERQK